jgi:MFS family permease
VTVAHHLSNTFRSLRVRNYRLYFSGQLVSIAGTWMQTIAIGWLVLDLSDDSGLAVGTVTALQFLPSLLFSIPAGAWVDRLDRRKLLMSTQSGLGVLALVLATLDLTDVVELWMVYVVVLCIGCITVLDTPARQSFPSDMVGDEYLSNAIGLNSAVFNSARIVGPAIGAAVIAVAGTGWCFLVNAVSFLAVILCLALMRASELHPVERVARAKGQAVEGLRYAWKHLRPNVCLLAIFGTMALNWVVVLPLLAKVTFDGTAGTYGLMTSAQGVGALGGALFAASIERPTVRIILVSCGGFCAFNLAASVAPGIPVLIAFLVPMGFFSMVFLSAMNVTLQLSAPGQLRGRMMALYSLLMLGSTPIGGPIAGWISERFNPRWGLAAGGLSVLIGLAVFGPGIHRARRTTGGLDQQVLEPAVS